MSVESDALPSGLTPSRSSVSEFIFLRIVAWSSPISVGVSVMVGSWVMVAVGVVVGLLDDGLSLVVGGLFSFGCSVFSIGMTAMVGVIVDVTSVVGVGASVGMILGVSSGVFVGVIVCVGSTISVGFGVGASVVVISGGVEFSAKTFEDIKILGVRDWKIRRNPVKRETAF